MELLNFSAGESARINRALVFLAKKEIDLDQLSPRIVIVKTENFIDECQQADRYFPTLGLESGYARLVFNTAKEGSHKILLNKAAISGLSYVHSLVTELVHLANLSKYVVDHGNIYRFEPEQAIAQHFYEFLLWSKFQAMRLATRAHALVSWHEINGEEPPASGCYQFAKVAFPSDDLLASLTVILQAESLSAWLEGLWVLFEELAFYLGRLAFYQQEPHPENLDEQFPAESIKATIGLDNCLAFYGTLLRARNYPAWQAEKHTLRRFIIAMQEQGKMRFAGTN